MKYLTHTKRLLLPTLAFFSISSYAQTDDSIEEIVVRSHPLAQNGSAQSVTVLSGDELAQKLQGSIGATVAREAGVQSASYGTAVGRPFIRGLGTTRIKTTQDSIDTLDVAVTSGDHPVAVEPFIADQVEILRGPSSLLYGAGAIGGVVNVETGRIARTVAEEAFSGGIELRGADNGNATTAAVRLDGKFTDALHWHLDGFTRDADEFDIPGIGESDVFLASGNDQASTTPGTLENSQSESQGGAVGLSWVQEAGFVGFSVSAIESEFGLFGEPSIIPFIDLEQTRFDIEAQANNPFAGIKSINFRIGVNDYEHAELALEVEDDPSSGFGVGTLFENDAFESRLIAEHEAIGGFEGTFGLQFGDREFSALGEEAFIQETDVDTIGLFWVAERSFNSFDLELGARIDQVDYDSSIPLGGDLGNIINANPEFTSNSFSAGVIFPITDNLSISGLLDFSTRAPSIEELFSYGPHIATRSYEVGNVDFDEEEAFNVTLGVNYQVGALTLTANIYQTVFDGFIYEVNTGETVATSPLTIGVTGEALEVFADLPVFEFQQEDTTVIGFDVAADIALGQFGGGGLNLSFLFDTVDASTDDTPTIGNRNIPRLPASRFGVGLDWGNDLWTAAIDFLNVDDQEDTQVFELPTDSFNDLSIFVNRKIELQGSDLAVFLHGRNLTDDEQRHHPSIVKDIGPAPGRTIEIGARLQF